MSKHAKNTFNALALLETFNPEKPLPEAMAPLLDGLRAGGTADASDRMDALLRAMQAQPQLTARIGQHLHEWLTNVNFYPALISLGIFSRRGFLRELMTRLYDRINPPPINMDSTRDALALIFKHPSDSEWLDTLRDEQWLALYQLLAEHTDRETWQSAREKFLYECYYALEMLGIWVAAEELEPELMRIDRRLIDIDSAFIALHRELHLFVQSGLQQIHEPEITIYEPDHVWVMLDQCREQVMRLRRRGAGSAGSSVSVAHLLERLEQTLERIERLMAILTADTAKLYQQKLLELWRILLQATSEKSSLSAVWTNSIGLLSKSITQNKSNRGTQYIAHGKQAYFALFRSAAGAGILIALMSLLKIHIERIGLAPLPETVLVSLNYGLGFVLVHILHFTIATKQPAMTAASFAAEVERGESGRAAHRKLARLLIDVNRSQWAAVWGNVSTAIALASTIALGAAWLRGAPLLSPASVDYQLQSITPITGLALFYAAIAGLWLFCSGLIAGYFDNRADYLEMRLRLRQHPLMRKLFKPQRREKLADYLHDNYGALAGNFFFGVLLGSTSYIGYLINLPLDIRHVAFSSANLGFSAVSAQLNVMEFLIYLVFVMMIGFVNLWVSFTLALLVAIRARGTRISRFSNLLSSVWQQVRDNPLCLFFPISGMQQTVREDMDNDKA